MLLLWSCPCSLIADISNFLKDFLAIFLLNVFGFLLRGLEYIFKLFAEKQLNMLNFIITVFMLKSNLLQALKQLDSKEIREFGELVKSPYFKSSFALSIF